MNNTDAPRVNFEALKEVDWSGEAIKLELNKTLTAHRLGMRLLRHGPGTAVFAVRPGQVDADGDGNLHVAAIEEVFRVSAVAALLTIRAPEERLTPCGCSLEVFERPSLETAVIHCHAAIAPPADGFSRVECELITDGGKLLSCGMVQVDVRTVLA